MRRAKTSIITSLLISLALAIGAIVPAHASPIYDGYSEHIHGPECDHYIVEETITIYAITTPTPEEEAIHSEMEKLLRSLADLRHQETAQTIIPSIQGIPEELKNGFTMDITKNFLTSETTTTINTGNRIIDTNAPENRSINEFIQSSLMQTATVATAHQNILARSEMFQDIPNNTTTRHTCNTHTLRVTSRTNYGPEPLYCSTAVEFYDLLCSVCSKLTGTGSRFLFGPTHNWIGTVNGSNISFTCSNCGRRS